MLRERAGYRCAKPLRSFMPIFACNARPVHTDGPIPTVTKHPRPRSGTGAARSPHKGTSVSGMHTHRSCPPLVIAAIALPHRPVANGPGTVVIYESHVAARRDQHNYSADSQRLST